MIIIIIILVAISSLICLSLFIYVHLELRRKGWGFSAKHIEKEEVATKEARAPVYPKRSYSNISKLSQNPISYTSKLKEKAELISTKVDLPFIFGLETMKGRILYGSETFRQLLSQLKLMGEHKEDEFPFGVRTFYRFYLAKQPEVFLYKRELSELIKNIIGSTIPVTVKEGKIFEDTELYMAKSKILYTEEDAFIAIYQLKPKKKPSKAIKSLSDENVYGANRAYGLEPALL